MKTSKEMQLRILDKMRENIENGKCAFKDIQYKDEDDGLGFVSEDDCSLHFDILECRVKPETITINGVEIPKPLSRSEFHDGTMIYMVADTTILYIEVLGLYVTNHGGKFIYKTKEEAIEASKLLFGIED